MKYICVQLRQLRRLHNAIAVYHSLCRNARYNYSITYLLNTHWIPCLAMLYTPP
nr:MAG TPA: hypothetical protein [Bacteriophage sp.]